MRPLRVFLDEIRELRELINRVDPDRLPSPEAAPLVRRLQVAMCTHDNGGRLATGTRGQQLTRREVSILKRLESGLSNKEIAQAIFVSESTLEWHLQNAYSKLNVKNRSGAMARARALRFV